MSTCSLPDAESDKVMKNNPGYDWGREIAEANRRRKRIIVNKIRCRHCGDVIESRHIHDSRKCSCGKVAVDGGPFYLRRVFPDDPWEDYYEELSVTEDPPPEGWPPGEWPRR